MATPTAMNPVHDIRHGFAPERLSHASRERQHRPFPSDRLEITIFDDVLRANLPGSQSSATDPAANRLGVATGSAGGFWDGQHVVRRYNIPPIGLYGAAVGGGVLPCRNGISNDGLGIVIVGN